MKSIWTILGILMAVGGAQAALSGVVGSSPTQPMFAPYVATAGSGDPIWSFAGAIGRSNTIVLGPGDYYPTLPATLPEGTHLVGIGRPRIHWDSFVAHTVATTNEACLGIVSNNITIEGIDFVQTNKTGVPIILLGGPLNGGVGVRGPTNLYVLNCRFYGKNDVYYNPTTNYQSGRWKGCYFESQWDVFAMNPSPGCTNDWEWDDCEFQSLDSTIAGDNSAFKNCWNAAGNFKGTNIWRNCRFKDNSTASDAGYQTWIYPPTALDGAFEFHNCKFENGQQLCASQGIANRYLYFGGQQNFTFDFAPFRNGMTLAGGATIQSGSITYSSNNLATGFNPDFNVPIEYGSTNVGGVAGNGLIVGLPKNLPGTYAEHIIIMTKTVAGDGAILTATGYKTNIAGTVSRITNVSIIKIEYSPGAFTNFTVSPRS